MISSRDKPINNGASKAGGGGGGHGSNGGNASNFKSDKSFSHPLKSSMAPSSSRTSLHSSQNTSSKRERHSQINLTGQQRAALQALMATGVGGLGIGAGGQLQQVQVFNDEGLDVTPQSLLMRPSHAAGNADKEKRGKQNQTAQGNSTTDKSQSHMSSENRSSSFHESVHDFLNALDSSTAFKMNTNMRTEVASEMDDETSSYTSLEEAPDPILIQNSAKVAEPVPEPTPLTDEQLNKQVRIHLRETDTIWLLEIPGICISADSPDEPLVRAANTRYKGILEMRAQNENLVHRGMQTFNDVQKNKDTQATARRVQHAEVQANIWSIYDAMHTAGVNTELDPGNPRTEMELDAIPGLELKSMPMGSSMAGSHFSGPSGEGMPSDDVFSSMEESSDMTSSGMAGTTEHLESNDAMGLTRTGVSQIEVPQLSQLNQENLRFSLRIMESALIQNNYANKMFVYRGVTTREQARALEAARAAAKEAEEQRAKDEEGLLPANNNRRAVDAMAANIPSLQLLWSFRCDLTRGRPVTCLAWNKENNDILAVAYGEVDLTAAGVIASAAIYKGLILCWSLKNTEYPERIYRCKTSVTALDFSRSNANLLAAGFTDGRIAIYDARRRGNDDAAASVVSNSSSGGKHHDAVWELRWVERERVGGEEQSRGDVLVSISTDGRVTQWILRKGMEFTDLMSLKRVSRQFNDSKGAAASAEKISSLISRQAGGLCFDFKPSDNTVYLAGTEDGNIHRCSSSYNEQYLDSYFGHTGPVYRVKWSPFLHSAFLSCSADWTARLWSQESEESVFKFQSGRDAVADICWSPTTASVFGCVSSDGRIEIWDLQQSTLDPCINHSVLDRKLTTISFSPNSNAIVTGDESGSINVYKLQKIFSDEMRLERRAQRLGQTALDIPFSVEAAQALLTVDDTERSEESEILHQIMVAKNQFETSSKKEKSVA